VTHPALGLAIAYLAGSIPAAFIAGRVAGVDLRNHGSGNLGATNVTRVLGWKVGLPVYLFDTAKGAAPVLLLPAWLGVADSRGWALAYGVAAIAGHVRPIFLLGRGGGKGVATAAGAILGAQPFWAPVVLVVWVGVLATSRWIALASVAAALCVLGIALVRGEDVLWALGLAAVIVVRHRANLMLRLAVRRAGEA